MCVNWIKEWNWIWTEWTEVVEILFYDLLLVSDCLDEIDRTSGKKLYCLSVKRDTGRYWH